MFSFFLGAFGVQIVGTGLNRCAQNHYFELRHCHQNTRRILWPAGGASSPAPHQPHTTAVMATLGLVPNGGRFANANE